MKWFNDQQKQQSLTRAGDVSSRLPEILLDAQKAAQALLHGQHGRRKAGTGDDFWQYRHYDPLADSASQVDWRRSAKGDQLFIREREEERPKSAILWIDPSSSMFYSGDPKKQISKFEYGFTLACILAYVLTEGGERVQTPDQSFSATHSKDVHRLAELILKNNARPAFENIKNAQIFIISDFLEQDLNWLRNIKKAAIARNARLNVIVPVDPAEALYPFTGHIRFENMTSDRKFETRNAVNLKNEYLDKLKAHHDMIRNITGTDNVVFCQTDHPIQQVALDVIRPFLR